jgi:hypothetical protein
MSWSRTRGAWTRVQRLHFILHGHERLPYTVRSSRSSVPCRRHWLNGHARPFTLHPTCSRGAWCACSLARPARASRARRRRRGLRCTRHARPSAALPSLRGAPVPPMPVRGAPSLVLDTRPRGACCGYATAHAESLHHLRPLATRKRSPRRTPACGTRLKPTRALCPICSRSIGAAQTSQHVLVRDGRALLAVPVFAVPECACAGFER